MSNTIGLIAKLEQQGIISAEQALTAKAALNTENSSYFAMWTGPEFTLEYRPGSTGGKSFSEAKADIKAALEVEVVKYKALWTQYRDALVVLQKVRKEEITKAESNE